MLWSIHPMIFRLITIVVALPAAARADELSFNRDIRPILAGNCYDCHGPDKEARKAKLRLDERESAAEVLKPDGELIARISSTDPDEVMPPPKSKRKLKPEQIALLKRWIAEGAKYEKHWAFEPPKLPEAPVVYRNNWGENDIDLFVLGRLEREKLSPSPEADRLTLARRIYLDLIGLPPSPEEADAFAKDTDPKAYEKLVDRLLASDHYGEKWARHWLDLARYADTNGYEKDRPRSIWPYRDWVIHSLNIDKPYDQFTIEQIAGDMLPNATAEQRIATGFHRNTMLNEEGGIDPLEYRFYAMVDRVATTGTVWMGLTTGCAQCHTHKYDPITHTDYYRFMALMNNANEPALDVPDEDIAKRRANIEAEIAKVEDEAMAKIDEKAFHGWLEKQRSESVPWRPLVPIGAESNLPKLSILDDGSVFASGDFTKRDVYKLRFKVESDKPITAIRLAALPDKRLPSHGPGAAYYEGRSGDFFLSDVTATAGDKKIAFADASISYGKIAVGSGKATGPNVIDGKGSTGWSTANREGERHHLVLNLAEPLAGPVDLKLELLFERHFVAGLGRFRFDFTTSDRKATAKPGDAPDPHTASTGEMKRHYVRTAKPFAAAQKKIAEAKKKLPKFPTTMVLSERAPDNPRKTYRHHRGEYLKAEEEVTPAVPGIFAQIDSKNPNRLDLARWLVSEKNPLAARVAVNRAWQAIFGRGLVKTPDDFGTQSDPPTHPELLDWLAVAFVRDGWSMKKLHRLIVTSATYKQSSKVSPTLLMRDPHNKLYARGPRFRMDGEIVRDTLLAASGLLSKKIGGPSVYPPQPGSVTALAYGNTKWNVSKGEDRYRRSLYTFSKRTAPFAAYTVFDGPTGENCVARRNRSNTPLQALTLLNDAMFLEMAKTLASEAMKLEASYRAEFILRRCLTREPTIAEKGDLQAYAELQRYRFSLGEMDADKFLGAKNANHELAAWTLAARAVFNFDEMITKE